MNLHSIKQSTLEVLETIPEGEIETVTLPMLRERVADKMGISIEELRSGSGVKSVIMEAFEEFLLKPQKTAASEASNTELDDVESEEQQVGKRKATKRQKQEKSAKIDEEEVTVSRRAVGSRKGGLLKKTEKSPSSTSTTKSSALKNGKGRKEEPESEGEGEKEHSIDENCEMGRQHQHQKKNEQIERLKSYVFKCGVRKVWKKELEGLSESQCISKLQAILRELGVEGRPTLDQCKEIKARREFEAEMREIDHSNIIEGKRRRQAQDQQNFKESSESEAEAESDSLVSGSGSDSGSSRSSSDSDSSSSDSDSSSSDSDSSGPLVPSRTQRINLQALGDSESD